MMYSSVLLSSVSRSSTILGIVAYISLCLCEDKLPLVSPSEENEQQQQIGGAMEKFQIIPDVIPTPPSSLLHVKFGELEVQLGNELEPKKVKDIPSYISWKALPYPLRNETNVAVSFYTLVMFDPDASPKPNPSSWLHWLVANIPAAGKDLASGDTRAEFISSGPAQGTGLHRYILLLYKQTSQVLFTNESKLHGNSPKLRDNFSIQDLVHKFKLIEEPVAGNFYLAQWDEYVPELYAYLDGGGGSKDSNNSSNAGPCSNKILMMVFTMIVLYLLNFTP